MLYVEEKKRTVLEDRTSDDSITLSPRPKNLKINENAPTKKKGEKNKNKSNQEFNKKHETNE